jgi:hypothetical protein
MFRELLAPLPYSGGRSLVYWQITFIIVVIIIIIIIIIIIMFVEYTGVYTTTSTRPVILELHH